MITYKKAVMLAINKLEWQKKNKLIEKYTEEDLLRTTEQIFKLHYKY